MNSPRRSSLPAVHLDMIRGLSAVLVVMAHIRTRLFSTGSMGPLYYWIFNHGSTAVTVFFVLSGFFIASSIKRSYGKGTWSTRSYVNARLSRLMVPLIPALLLTLFWDRLGLGSGNGPAFYQQVLPAGRPWPYSLSLPTFLGNLLFLQENRVPFFGSNGPLWSLANEFWYYVAFPFLFFAVMPGRSTVARAALGLVGIATLVFCGRTVSSQFVVWLLGAAIAFLPARRWAGSRAFRWAMGFAFIFATTSGWLWHPPIPRLREYAVGLPFALFVYGLVCMECKEASPRYELVASSLASISYTLYLVHYPLLAYLTVSVFKGGLLLEANVASTAMLLGLTLLLILYAVVIWFVAEKHTGYIRSLMEQIGTHQQAPTAPTAE